jgi:hypothetical protein
VKNSTKEKKTSRVVNHFKQTYIVHSRRVTVVNFPSSVDKIHDSDVESNYICIYEEKIQTKRCTDSNSIKYTKIVTGDSEGDEFLSIVVELLDVFISSINGQQQTEFPPRKSSVSVFVEYLQCSVLIIVHSLQRYRLQHAKRISNSCSIHRRPSIVPRANGAVQLDRWT